MPLRSRLRLALLALSMLAACRPAPLAKRIVGRYTATAAEGSRVLDLQPGGHAVWTESTSRGGLTRDEGQYTVVGDSVLCVFEKFGVAGALHGERSDTLDASLTVQTLRVPLTFVRIHE